MKASASALVLMEYDRTVLAFYVHHPTGAFSRPLAKQKLGG
jgi:hypothetical protein